MSALLEKPRTGGKQTLPRPEIARKPAVKPELKIRARIIQRKRPNHGPVIVGKCLMFVTLLGITFMVSSFTGQLLLEGARQERMEAKRRANDAKQAEEVLAAKLRTLVSAGGIEDWALSHGFVAPESQIEEKAKTRGLLASR
ncbi:MAG: hypothetical protein ACAH95_04015 [Fimbriimonas sp.]